MRSEVLQLIDDLAADDRARLTSVEVRELLGLSSQAASNLLSRLVRDGFLDRVAPGVYAPRPLGCSVLVRRRRTPCWQWRPRLVPSRIASPIAQRSTSTALLRSVRIIQVALPRRVQIRQLSGRRLQPILEGAQTICLGALDIGHGARVSSVERALLECASRPALAGGWHVLAAAGNSRRVESRSARGTRGRVARAGRLAAHRVTCRPDGPARSRTSAVGTARRRAPDRARPPADRRGLLVGPTLAGALADGARASAGVAGGVIAAGHFARLAYLPRRRRRRRSNATTCSPHASPGVRRQAGSQHMDDDRIAYTGPARAPALHQARPGRRRACRRHRQAAGCYHATTTSPTRGSSPTH